VDFGALQPEGDAVAIDLQGSVLVLQKTLTGDVRIRFGPLDRLATTADRVLVDAAAHGGLDVRTASVLAGPTDSLITLWGETGERDGAATTGLVALRVSPDGAVTPMHVRAQ
jgi:hypothetical protein